MKKNLLLLSFVFFMSGCTMIPVMNAINSYDSLSGEVSLGDNKDEVISLLSPSQDGLMESQKKRPEQFMSNGKRVDIYFFRSSWHSDGLTTDDEFTPYIFVDDVLTGIGWSTLGGPKTQAMPAPVDSNQSDSSQQILNHGAGGCTPNFSTGGCL